MKNDNPPPRKKRSKQYDQYDLKANLLKAVRSSDAPEVRSLLRCSADPNTRTSKEKPVLNVAARALDPDVVRALLLAKAKVNAASDRSKSSALRVAFGSYMKEEADDPNSLSVIKCLVRKKADLRQAAKDGVSPITFFWGCGTPRFFSQMQGIVKFPHNFLGILLLRVAKFKRPSYFQDSEGEEFFSVCRPLANNNFQKSLALLKTPEGKIEKRYVDQANALGLTPVMAAVFLQQHTLLKLLLTSKANPNVPTQGVRRTGELKKAEPLCNFLSLIVGKHPLFMALKYNSYSAAVILLRSPQLDRTDFYLRDDVHSFLSEKSGPQMKNLFAGYGFLGKAQAEDEGYETAGTESASSEASGP